MMPAFQRPTLIDELARLLRHADILDGRDEQSRDYYRAKARGVLRAQEPCAASVARYKAQQAALSCLPACLSDVGKQALREAVQAALDTQDDHLCYGKPEQDERAFEQLIGVPAPRAFTVVEGGR